MYDDLFISNYSGKEEIKQYIHGSAEVVGLMCLKVFVNGNSGLYEELKQPATRLGSAFQKVNFLRDLKTDTEILNRQYFPELAGKRFTDEIRGEIIEDICADFSMSYPGIKSLPGRSRLAVAIAFFFYKRLLDKIRGTPADIIISSRVRLSRIRKFLLIVRAFVAYIFRLI
jgi:phytoene/squalene synthetase